ncbi:MAG TPA: ABC transporter ATP-binding protein [Planctomycetaceae bacterium]|nr:ABC transporter ATP-binding protein [Planctomycetaceae bacterium]|tara:strand:+ start:669 stop:1343 length:675 start_codon:yes stop_codon:yes gene_type:complete
MSLELKNVRKNYREPNGHDLPVLDIPHFKLETGEQAALVGSSGGGKTTLLNVISGITKPDSGEVLIDDIEITRLPEAGRDRFRAERIGFVFQTFNLLPAFTAFENVLLGMSFARGKADRSHAKQLLESVGLGHRLTHKPAQLSVGEQQRVAIARSLANRPSLLLADEPTASVDPANQETILKLIGEICREHNVSLLLVTHSPEIATQFDRTIPLQEFNKVLQNV